jgi:crotonobetaine/carnitine-CoA ligase
VSGPRSGAANVAPILPLEQRGIGDMLLRQVEARPGAAFLEFPTFSMGWTYAEFLAEASRIGGGLRGLGLEPGERVGIMLDNRPEYVFTWFGSVLAGTVDVSINHGLRGARLSHQLRRGEVRALVCDSESAAAVLDVRDDVPTLETLILTDGDVRATALRTLDFDSLFDGPAIDRYPSSPKETTSIRYTSGTTGPAKAVARTHSALAAHCAHFVWLTEYGPEDTLYTCFPLHHGIASVLGLITTLLSGGRLVVDERFSASRYWARIREHEATLAHVINPLVPILMAQPPSPLDRDHRCTRLWTATPNAAFEARFATRPIYFYGLAEGGTIAYTPPGETAPPGASGKASPLFDLRIVDEDEYPVAPGVKGEIVWRPTEPHVMSPGYVGDPEATVRAWRGLWFHSGDAGTMDERGYLFLAGRMGDQIRRKGVNISAEEVESAALEYEAAAEVAAIAVPSELSESEVKLCVVPRAGEFDVQRFRGHLAEVLPAEMVPRYVEVREALPRTDTHKIAKAKLRAEGESGITPATLDFEADRRRPVSGGEGR